MAKFELRFFDFYGNKDWIKCFEDDDGENSLIKIVSFLNSDGENQEISIYLDKSTAIKFAKTLRTEINKIQE
jgi:hypothetical protein